MHFFLLIALVLHMLWGIFWILFHLSAWSFPFYSPLRLSDLASTSLGGVQSAFSAHVQIPYRACSVFGFAPCCIVAMGFPGWVISFIPQLSSNFPNTPLFKIFKWEIAANITSDYSDVCLDLFHFLKAPKRQNKCSSFTRAMLERNSFALNFNKDLTWQMNSVSLEDSGHKMNQRGGLCWPVKQEYISEFTWESQGGDAWVEMFL